MILSLTGFEKPPPSAMAAPKMGDFIKNYSKSWKCLAVCGSVSVHRLDVDLLGFLDRGEIRVGQEILVLFAGDFAADIAYL